MYSKTNEKQAVKLREQINLIRDTNKNWSKEESVIEFMDELEEVGFFYDEDSWEVYPDENEYYDESPLELYVDDEDDDDGFSNENNRFDFDDDDYNY